jgi:chemotaxis regulatin CheY-phosphate phosphatase CheZ
MQFSLYPHFYSGVETKYAAAIVERPNKYQNEADMLFIEGSMRDAINHEDVASGQYDIDDLLLDLGF